MTQSAEQQDGVGMFGVVWGAALTPLTCIQGFSNFTTENLCF